MKPGRDLLALLGRATPELQRALYRLARARLRGDDPAPPLAALARALQGAQRFADLYGRLGILRRAALLAAVGEVRPVPAVPFGEAIDDLLDRHPRLAKGWEEVQEVYSREHAFALARSASVEVTREVQRALHEALGKAPTVGGGAEELRAAAEIAGQDMKEWTESYSRLVFRTNAATAFSAGRFRAMADPEVQEMIPALEYQAILDSDVRPNHAALHGLVMAADDPRWDVLSPPTGYNCRCQVVPTDAGTLRRRGLLDADGNVKRMPTPAGGFPDPGFGRGRPDRAIYGYSAAR